MSVSQINHRLWNVRSQLKSGCNPGQGARPLHPDEVDNLKCEEDCLLLHRRHASYIAARLSREAEQTKLAQQAELSLPLRDALQATQTSSHDVSSPSDLERASTTDLLSIQSKLRAAEGKVKLLLQQKADS